MRERKDHPGYVDGSEQFIAAVWYVAKEAEREWQENEKRIRRGGLPRWYFLNRVRRSLRLPARYVPYSVMRAELEEFAALFGVESSNPAAPRSRRNIEAAKEFGS